MKKPVVVSAVHLQKQYGKVLAVNDVSFEIYGGEVFCLIGPNGAGKTTTVECLEGHRKPDDGTVRVLGYDPWQDNGPLRQRIGVQLQESNLPDRLKVWEAMDLFASFYQTSIPWEPLLETLGLTDKRNAYYHKLSGGQKQRLFIGLALINHPDLVFLDELTTGLDPHARRDIWKLIEGLRHRGCTVVLTTHFMDEAEHLADRVAILNDGRLLTVDTPSNIVTAAGVKTLEQAFLSATANRTPVTAADSQGT